MTNLLEARIRRDPPRSQREAIRLAVRRSVATLGPMPPDLIAGSVLGIVKGLFGDAYDAATDEQRALWLAMCDEEYRAAVGVADDDHV